MASPRQIRTRGRWILVVAAALLAVGIATVSWADTITADGDNVVAGDQGTVDLGSVAPGTTLTPKTSFRLDCTGKNHPDNGQTISLMYSTTNSTVPAGGLLSASTASIGPIPASWPDDTSGGGSTNCAATPQTLGDNGDSTVTITAPTTPGTYNFKVVWNVTLSPAGAGDSNAVSGNDPNVTYSVTVDNGPTVSSTTPSNGATGIALASNVAVTFSEPVNVAAGWFSISCGTSGSHAAAVSGGPTTFTLNPTSDFAYGETCTVTITAANVTDQDTNDPPNAMASDYSFSFSTVPPPDSTAPVISKVVTGTLGSGGWYRSNVTVAWTVTDPESAVVVDSGCGTQGFTSETDGTTSSCSAHSVGGSASDSVTVKIDKTDPSFDCTVPNQSAWHADNVSVPCTGSDGRSGLAVAGDENFDLATSVSDGVETNAANTGSRSVCDVAGNCHTAGPYSFKVDRKAPSVTCVTADGVWHASNVSISCSASDGGSQLADSGDASFSLSTNVVDGSETNDAQTGTHQVCDQVNNCTTAASVGGNKVDRKAPSVSCDSPDGLWHADDVSIACTASDGGSGVSPASDGSFSLSTGVADGTEDGNASTGSKDVFDAVGHKATAGSIGGNKVDRKAPQLSVCDAADGNWHAGNVTLHCLYTDGGSGAGNLDVSLSTSVGAGSESNDAAASASGAQSCDAVTNCAVSPADIGGNKVDRKGPSITLTTPPGGATYTLGQVVAASYGCSDGGSGPGTCAGDVANGSSIGTGSVGAKTFTVNATDAVGNAASVVHAYNVVFVWTGFFQPIDNLPGMNKAKAGSAIPVKFKLGGNQGLDIFLAGYPTSAAVTCGNTATADPVEETVTAGNSSLTYDAAAGQYVYVWKTQTAWANSCRTLTVKLVDATVHQANIYFVR